MRTVVKNTRLLEDCSKEDIRSFVDEIIEALTINEKIHIMSGQISEEKLLEDLFRINHYNVFPYPTGSVERHGIPNMRFVDGPRGVVAGSSTCFPVSIARGATFDRDLEEKVGEVIGTEIRAHDGNYFGGVCINLMRNPRWGRAQECYGEDQYHMGEMGAALVRGVQRHNVMACIKHFALNSIDDARFKVNVQIDKRTLHEVYLPHFKRCIDAGAASVMGAYNKVLGEQASESEFLLKDILRDMWGFEGFTISDFLWAIKDATKAVKSGMDIEMPCIYKYVNDLPKAIEKGEISEDEIDTSVKNILRTLLYFETRKDPQSYDEALISSDEHIALAREVAEKSIVLLKNEGNILPIDKSTMKKILILGELGDMENIGDHGSSRVHPKYAVTPLKGIMNKIPKAQVLYSDGKDLNSAKKLAEDADLVLIVTGYIYSDEGEYLSDRDEDAGLGGDRKSMRLKQQDVDLINGLKGINPNTVVSITGSSSILIDEWEEDIPSILFTFYSGMEGGNALADTLFGDVCPGGKLPYTVAYSEEDYPYFDPNCDEITYEYYHGYCKMEKENKKVLYPFGYGLSYTEFKLETREMHTFKDVVKFKVRVTNTGNYKGDEVVQLYIGCKGSAVNRPVKVLKDFIRVEVNPGDSAEILLVVRKSDMAYFDEKTNSFIDEDITYIAYIGNSSRIPESDSIEFKFT